MRLPRVGIALAGAGLLVAATACESITASECLRDSRSGIRFWSTDDVGVPVGRAWSEQAKYGFVHDVNDMSDGYCWVNVSDDATWTSSNPQVVRIGAPARYANEPVRMLQALSLGSATITVEHRGKRASKRVRVCTEQPWSCPE